MYPRLSICIPTYNGLQHIEKLLEALTKCLCQEFEIVVSDDCSSDGTWEFLQEFSRCDSRVRVFRNDHNLGMDHNFAHSVELAVGEFVWLCGQDDLIAPEGIAAVLDLIDRDVSTDFIHMSYEMVCETKTVTEWKTGANLVPPLRGLGLLDFLASNNEKLPTFLPEFVIRRSRWQEVDVTKYYGTCYCQVGVFLEVSKNLRWCRIVECYVKGNLPNDGWQTSPLAYARIMCDYFVMLNRALKREVGLTESFARRQYALHRRQLVYALLLVRTFFLEDRVALLGELRRVSRRYLEMRGLVIFCLHLPRFLCRQLLQMAVCRHQVYRKLGWRH